MKRLRFQPNVPAEIRAIEQSSAIRILEAIHNYAANGDGSVRPLSGKFQGLPRLRVGEYRVIFSETDALITIHHVRNRRDAYR